MKHEAHLTPDEVVRDVYARPTTIRGFAAASVWDAEWQLVDRYFQQGNHILDLACGPGRAAIPLARKGFELTGIDFLPEVVEAAQTAAQGQDLSVEFLLMDATRMSFPDETFDGVVFLYNAYELVWGRDNRRRLLKEVYRVLRPGGVFILTSRSGFAFGKRWLAWPWLLFRTYLLKPLGLANPHLELCDVFSNDSYHRWQSPFGIRKDLARAGFSLLLFNSRQNLETGRAGGLFTNFSPDVCLFFVARKPE